MRICFVAYQYPPERRYDGGSTFAYTTARLLARRGHEVSVITATGAKEASRRTEEGVDVWRFHGPPYRYTFKQDFQRYRDVWQTVRQIKPQIIQLNETTGEGILPAFLARKEYGLVTRMSGYGSVTKAHYEQPFRLQARVNSYLARLQIRRSDALFSPGVHLARHVEEFVGLPTGTIRHIPNSIELDLISQYHTSKLPIEINAPYLMFLGRLQQRKGIEYLAQALPAVWERYPYLKIVLVGVWDADTFENLSARDFLEKKAGKYAKNLIFTGHLPHEQALTILAHAQLLIFPTIWEAFGFVCVEAMALGVPVISTYDSGGPGEILGGVDDNEVIPGSVPAGWLVPRRDAQALAKAILEALGDKEALRKAKERAMLRVHRFDAEAVVSKIEALYQEVCEQRFQTKRNSSTNLIATRVS